MKKDNIQITIIEDELGAIKTFKVSKRKIKKSVFSAIALVLLLFFSSVYSGIKLLNNGKENRELYTKLERLEKENKNLNKQVVALTKEKEKTVKALAKRVKMIDSIMKSAGMGKKVKVSKKNEGKGGVYVPLENMDGEILNSSIKNIDYIIKKFKNTPLGIPTYGRLTSKFGIRRDPFTGTLALHEGIDISNRRGTKIRATADGIVTKAGRYGNLGNAIFIKHSSGYTTVYAHLRKIYVKKWQKVKLGEVIGEMGSTGRSTGPHLHYGIKKNKKWINPIRFLEVSRNVWKK